MNSQRPPSSHGVVARVFLRFALVSLSAIICAVIISLWKSQVLTLPTQATSSGIVISQVYGGAGCGTAGCSTYKNDYIELFNRGNSAVSVNGWSVQYSAATGTSWQVTNLTNVTIQPGQYYLVGESAGANGLSNIPTADASNTILMSATAGKVTLVNSTTALSGACPVSTSIVDLVGYGATANCSETANAPAPSTTTADIRGSNGCTETDNNSADFTAIAPNPRNTASALAPCGGGGVPTISINNVTQPEGNAGTTTFTFLVSLSQAAGAGGVTFDIATQDNTATTANNDYVGKSLTNQIITQGNSSYQFDVTVNGDATNEPNETFFVNVTNANGATPASVQGTGTITNDDITLTPIHTIQGSATTSPFSGSSVNTTGIVTGIKSGSSGGFFIQQPDATIDADPNTSEGIFVFTGGSVPAAAVIGNLVQVSGTIQEFIPSSDTNQKPMTEFAIGSTVSLLSTGNPLPAPIVISATDTLEPGLDNLERLEGMRVKVNSLTVVGSTQGSITESSATVSSSGVFFGVVTGVSRPFREAGVNVSDPLPVGAPANVPRFDENPERIRVDSNAEPGTTSLDVAAGTVITNLTGEMDYSVRAWTILPEAANPPTVGASPGSVPAPTATANELTVASFNMERFFDNADDAGVTDPILTLAAYNRRLAKASLIIRAVQKYPDVIGVEEVEKFSVLTDVANQVNNDAVSDGQTPNYVPYLVEGNDIGGIDVGFLVKSSRVTAHSVTQIELGSCDHVTPSLCYNYTNPNDGSLDILNDRPPLVLIASIARTGGGRLGFTVIVNHLRSLNGVDDNTISGSGTVGARVREKRRKQAEFLANYIQGRQTANPNEKIITVGDMNAFRLNDGFVDTIGTILGNPTPADQVVLASADLVNPNQTDLLDTLSSAERYSYNFDGNAQTLDHVIVNAPALAILSRFAIARDDSDYAVKNYESTNDLRISDHDQPIAYFSLTAPTATDGTIGGRISTADGMAVSGAVVTLGGTQSRKTITDANGFYHFDHVETNGFYNVTPLRANYNFSPASRAFSFAGPAAEAAFTGKPSGETNNPLDTPEYFVRQQYLDVLSREPDEPGFNYWTDEINRCGGNANCLNNRRVDIAVAFFVEEEFQRTSAFINSIYRSALGRAPAFSEYTSDRSALIDRVDVDGAKYALSRTFVQRPQFVQQYQFDNSAESFVDALLANVWQTSNLDLRGNRESLLALYRTGSNSIDSRALVILKVSDDQSERLAEYNRAFVLTEYFSYLQRDPDNYGYQFWLNVITNIEPGNYRGIVCAFVTSQEYQQRFSVVVSRQNGDCSH